ncbi:MAG: phage tail assembly chaperone [Pseudomonadota bacterium]
MTAQRGFDWPNLLKMGVREAGLKPNEFWALTPAEVTLLLGLDAVEKPLNRARLEEMDRLFAGQSKGE